METDFFPLIQSSVKACNIILHRGGFKIVIVGRNSTLSPNVSLLRNNIANVNYI